MNIVKIMMLVVAVGAHRRKRNKKKRGERPEKNFTVMLRTFLVRLLEEVETGKKVSKQSTKSKLNAKGCQGDGGAASRKRQRSVDDDGDDMRDVSGFGTHDYSFLTGALGTSRCQTRG